MKYPKIDSLYKRQFTEKDPVTGEIRYLDKGKSGNPLIIGDYARKEFESIKYWTVTEKVDGTNIRINIKRSLAKDSESKNLLQQSDVIFGGRKDNASIPADLFRLLSSTFTIENLNAIFKDSNSIILFGEGYGGKIQARSKYRKDVAFVLFDAFIDGWWLNVSDVHTLANRLGIKSVPFLMYDYPKVEEENEKSTFIWTKEQIFEYVKSNPESWLYKDDKVIMEGIVARSCPMMMFREKPVISENPVVHADYHTPIMFKLKCKDLL